MTPQLIIGFVTEGTTDHRFLETIIQKTFEDIAFECDNQIEIMPVCYFDKQKGSFIEQVEQHARKAFDIGVSVLCIHTDADDVTDHTTFSFKINPAFNAVKKRSKQQNL